MNPLSTFDKSLDQLDTEKFMEATIEFADLHSPRTKGFADIIAEILRHIAYEV
jgi:hypothetical protein